MKKVTHDVIINTQTHVCTVKTPIEIKQGDECSHVLLFQLKNSHGDISLDEDCKLIIEFYKDDHLIESEDVNVVNAYRGVFSYIIGNVVVKNFGRYTTNVKIIDCTNNSQVFTASFVTTVTKSHDYAFRSNEVALTKKFHDQLKDHLSDSDIHLNILDRDFLDTFNEETEELLQLIKDRRESEWIILNGCSHKKCTCGNYCTCLEYLVAIPVGKVMLTKSVRLKDYNNVIRTIDSPAYIIHTKESVKVKCDTCQCNEDDCTCDCCSKVKTTHYFTIVSSNDIILYDEIINPDESKLGQWISLRNLPTDFGKEISSIVDQVNQKISSLTDHINSQFSAVGQEISSLNSQIGNLSTQISNVEANAKSYTDSQVNEMGEGFSVVIGEMDDKIDEHIKSSDERFDQVDEDIEDSKLKWDTLIEKKH